MNESKISVRYGKAFFQSAEESKNLKAIGEDVIYLQEFMKNDEFKSILESPIVKTSRKLKLITSVFEGKINTLSLDFLKMVLQNKRESHIPGMLRNFQKYLKESKGIKEAELITPQKATDAQKKKFRDLLNKVYKTEIDFRESIDADLIGGFILKVEDEQFDASVSSALKKMEKKLLESAVKS